MFTWNTVTPKTDEVRCDGRCVDKYGTVSCPHSCVLGAQNLVHNAKIKTKPKNKNSVCLYGYMTPIK